MVRKNLTDIEAAQQIKIIGTDKDGTELTPVGSDERGRLKGVVSFADTGQMDAFQRIRTSWPTTLFDAQFHFDKRSVLWAESISGTAISVFDSNLHSVRMNLGTTSGNEVVRQTYRRFKYDPGKSTNFIGTAVLGQPKANTRKRFGLFDSANGLFFEVNGTTARVVTRSSTTGFVVDAAVDQADWNTDKFDGTGPSGITIDFNNTQIFVFDFQWLGSGRVRFGFYIGGEILYCHIISYANTVTGPYMQTANLPVRIEATNTGISASDTAIYQICQTLVRESLQEKEGVIKAVNSGIVGKIVGNIVETPVISLRVNPANFQAIIDILAASLYITGNNDILYRLYIGATLTGASWQMAGDFTQFDIAATALATPGVVVSSDYLRSSVSTSLLNRADILEFINVLIGSDLSNEPRIVTLTAQTFNGNASVYGTITFREVS